MIALTVFGAIASLAGLLMVFIGGAGLAIEAGFTGKISVLAMFVACLGLVFFFSGWMILPVMIVWGVA